MPTYTVHYNVTRRYFATVEADDEESAIAEVEGRWFDDGKATEQYSFPDRVAISVEQDEDYIEDEDYDYDNDYE